MLYAYPILLVRDDNGTFLVTCPDLPEVTTFAENQADARVRARDAIEEAIAARIARREDVPTPSLREGPLSAPLSEQTMLKATLWREMRAAGLRKADLARRLGWSGPQVNRLFDLNHASRLAQFDAAFGALGLNVTPDIVMEPSDELASLPLQALVQSRNGPMDVWNELVRRHGIVQEANTIVLCSMYQRPERAKALTGAHLDGIETSRAELRAIRDAMDQFLDRYFPARKRGGER
ncbi:MAG: type II toxin-antitoxin system HicB family antitoxin [Alphaproteobacteria bacterium]